MKKLILLFLLAFVSTALAQQSIQLRPGDSGPLWFDSSGQSIFNTSHVVSNDITPVPSSCGGSTGLALVGSDLAGTVTVGNSATTGCVITFAHAWAVAPTCIVSWPTGPLAAMSWTVSTTAITVTQTSTASNKLAYICVGTK